MKKKSTSEKTGNTTKSKVIQLKGPPSKSVVNFKPTIGSEDPLRHIGQSQAAQTLSTNSPESINKDNSQIAESAFTKQYKHLRNAKIRRANKNLDTLYKTKKHRISKSPKNKNHLTKAIVNHIFKGLRKYFRTK